MVWRADTALQRVAIRSQVVQKYGLGPLQMLQALCHREFTFMIRNSHVIVSRFVQVYPLSLLQLDRALLATRDPVG
jgi:hypothetical protein